LPRTAGFLRRLKIIQRMGDLLGELSYAGYFLDGSWVRLIGESANASHSANNFIFVQPVHVTRLRNHNCSV
jgi:hypothetical protein